MAASNWPQLNTNRESWVFLLLGYERNAKSEQDSASAASPLRYWEVGVGNADSLVRTTAAHVDSPAISSPADLLHCLLAELDEYRYDEMVIITPRKEMIRQLRRMLVDTHDRRVSLHGFNHVSLDALLQKYFDQELNDYDFDPQSWSPPRLMETDPTNVVSTGGAEKFWEIWHRVFRLVPASAIVGRSL
jgi:hypothetical protein